MLCNGWCYLKTQLFIHGHKIKVIPGFEDLTLLNSYKGHSGKLDLLTTCSSSVHDTTGGFAIILQDYICDFNVKLWKLAPEIPEKLFESRCASFFDVIYAMYLGICIHHFVNGVFAAIIPNFLHPAITKC